MKKYENAVFLDSSFVISSQILNDLFNDKAAKLISNFENTKVILILVPLVLDEFWFTINKALKQMMPAGFNRKSLNRLSRVTENLLLLPGLRIVNPIFKTTHVLDIPTIMAKYDLRPRDALIVKSMEILGVNKIATFDSDFDRVKGISVVK